ncbi:MAG: tRNA (adenosine(37)-N6)-threonylcarbamoyltransferase complex ATPase subunit type 1 TsaE [Lachnospiraceae bacterium]|nr:tRNA (adenosine(37)-N6)-threonylcarbamoyltransferase complex ATPase subunit type 1 TsaE [Lachnospiraceae bacterium]MDY5741408.1 tRNA (adenosine(37)-N6)-threonylcarbamoyltransferase complex ATPase subunit type 1 TsaE [Lachnospiraceae bacterium]
MKTEFISLSPTETTAVGKRLGQAVRPGTVWSLVGDVGVGKTVFTQGFAAGLGITEPITSPTFTLIQEYEEGRLPLYHFDVYRIGCSDELDELGFDEYIDGNGVCLIEWADLIEDRLPPQLGEIKIEKDYAKGEDYRNITITAPAGWSLGDLL